MIRLDPVKTDPEQTSKQTSAESVVKKEVTPITGTTVKSVSFDLIPEDKVVVIKQEKKTDEYKEKAPDLIQHEAEKTKETPMQNILGASSSEYTGLTVNASTDLTDYSKSRKYYASHLLDKQKDQAQKLLGQKRDGPETECFSFEKDLVKLFNVITDKKRAKKQLITA